MSRTVFVLGAGASADAGAPLMAGFIDAAEDLNRGGGSAPYKGSFDLMLRGIQQLQAAHAKSSVDDLNLESVFGAFEMARLVGKLGVLSATEVEDLPRAMRRVIAHTLERKMRFPIRGTQAVPTQTYGSFVGILKRMIAQEPGSVSVITFNYDIGLDYALQFYLLPADYCLGETPSGQFPLLKLHGSLNWTTCSCKAIAPFRIEDYFARRSFLLGEDDVGLDLSCNLSEAKHCGKAMDGEPALIPPTWNKAQYHAGIGRVWSRAAAELGSAENIFICGYSLPPTDEFFRHLIALGTISETRLRRLWVFNPDKSRREAFQALTGGASRGRFEYYEHYFATAITAVPRELMANV